MAELGEHEKIATFNLTRALLLAVPALDVVEAIPDGRKGPDVTLANLLDPFPLDWEEQWQCLDREESCAKI